MTLNDLKRNQIVEIEMNSPGWGRTYRVKVGSVGKDNLIGAYRLIRFESEEQPESDTSKEVKNRLFTSGAFPLSDIVSFKIVDSL